MNTLQALPKLLLLLSLLWTTQLTLAGAYEAKLSEEIFSAPDLCAHAPCTDVIPGATAFSQRKGQPPYVDAFADVNGKRELIGYVMLSTDITDTPAYSGKPVITLIGMDTTGKFTGAKVLKHSEPILLLGIPETALTNFLNQYVGLFAGDSIEVGHTRPDQDSIGPDGISGATVTVIAQNQVMLASATAVARQTGIIEPTIRNQATFAAAGKPQDWNSMVAEGSVQQLRVEPEQVGLPASATPFIELWFGYLNQPDIGSAILGDNGYRNLMLQLKDGEHALFVIRTDGGESFKGSGFVRGGIYDRVQVRQDTDSFTFRDRDYLNLYSIDVAGAPAYTESAIYIIRSPAFSGAYPWKFVFLGNLVDKATGTRTFTNFDAEYWLPARYLQGGRPDVVRPDPTWLKIWKNRLPEIILFTLFLIAVGVVYSQRNRLTRRSNRHNKWPVNGFKYVAWVISVTLVGFGLLAQPSVTQILTWFHSLLFKWTWQLFLSDPFIFLFWVFISVTVFLWGRGLFCGWLCPFGSLSELLYKIGGWIGLGRFQRALPKALHDKLKWIKYAVFFGLLGVSLFSMTLAEQLAEVEPFKTTFLVGMFNRSWPYTLFAGGILGISIFIERPFCKYLCPLGAALAVPSTFRWFGLQRKNECNRCEACAKGCGSLAIDKHGRIDQRECLLCLDCMVLYTDDHACPPLAQERKYREKNALPLTAISPAGYFLPLPETTARSLPARKIAVQDLSVDPRMPSDPATPACATPRNFSDAVRVEIIEHLWPWQRSQFNWQRTLVAFVLAGALAALLIGSFAWNGRLHTGLAIGLWTAWCLFEVLERLGSKPYVKEGPWWQRNYRKASAMDLVSYVGFKNLVIGALLFLLLQSLDLLMLSAG